MKKYIKLLLISFFLSLNGADENRSYAINVNIGNEEDTKISFNIYQSIHLDCFNGKIDKIKAYIKENDINSADKNGLTLLHVACMSGQLKIVKFLLSQNADVNCVDLVHHFTPLHMAAAANMEEIAELLIKNKSNLNALTKQGRTPITLAYSLNRFNFIKLLISKGADINIKDSNGHDIFTAACFSEKLDLVKFLISKGANVNSQDNQGWTPLHKASKGNLNLVKLLLDHVSNIDNKTYEQGLTPLHMACDAGHLNIVELLLSKSANIEEKTIEHFTPLHLAIQKGNLKLVEFLLSKGANIEAKTTLNITPLHVASSYGHIEITNLLLSKNADINAKTSDGFTPLQVAIHNKQLKAAHWLALEGAILDNVKELDIQYLSKIILKELDINTKDGKPIQLSNPYKACLIGKLGYFTIFFGTNEYSVADLNLKINGNSPFYIACLNGRLNIVKFLLENVKGIDINFSYEQYYQLFKNQINKNDGILKYLSISGYLNLPVLITEACKRQNLNFAIHLLRYMQLKNNSKDLFYIDEIVIISCLNGNLKAIKYLMNKFKINTLKLIKISKQYGFHSPLHIACEKNYLDIFKFWAEYNYDSHYEFFRAFPMHAAFDIAFIRGHLDIVKYILTTMPTFNEIYNKYLELQKAYTSEDLDLVEKLLNSGTYLLVNVHEFPNIDWVTLLFMASSAKNEKLVMSLLNDNTITTTGLDGATVLHHVCADGCFNLVIEIINKFKDIDINAKTDAGFTALHYACKHGHLDIVKHLVENCKSLDINATSPKGKTALDVARKNNHIEIVDYLESKNPSLLEID